ncbi:hypothetical protein FNF29_06986 [Cafeteria roenbergensis]|uniref:Uncharacterized protein n=1 Tax=Cafeteria roenbergensis TaxID=33653 RepID=A0A5A8C4U9_CAFRO|nr:hypothetical protein FNF29_06986 [Cafeteria roenbergensis]|eukprot:KAA0148043.1 hypothetical protein FNF29_06986 [Cafeteria roenbergensis]
MSDEVLVVAEGAPSGAQVWSFGSSGEVSEARLSPKLRALSSMVGAAWSHNGSAIACGGSNGRAIVVGLRSGRCITPVAHGSPVRMVRFSCTSRFMATVSDAQVRFWDLKQDPSSQLVFAFDMPARPLDADIDASQSRLAVAAADGAVYLWDLTAPPSTGPVAVDGADGFVAARFFATGHPTAEPLIVTAEVTGTVRVWNMGPAPRRQKRPKQGTAEEEAVIEREVGSAREEGAWEPLWAAPLTARHAARDDVVLATCCPYNGPASARVPGSKRVSPLSEAGPLFIASADGAGTLHLLDARARAHLITVDLGVAVTAVAMNVGARVMVLGDAGGTITMLEMEDWATIASAKCQDSPAVTGRADSQSHAQAPAVTGVPHAGREVLGTAPGPTLEDITAAVDGAVAARLDSVLAAIRQAHLESVKQAHTTRNTLLHRIQQQDEEIAALRTAVAGLEQALAEATRAF